MLGDANIRDPNISGIVTKVAPDTIVLQPPTEDTFFHTYYPNNTYGSLQYALYNLHVNNFSWCYYKFDFSSFPTGITITSAKLEVYNYVLITGSEQSVNLEAHRITEAWSEASLTYNNKPSHDADNMGLVSMASAWHLGWVEIPLTNLVEVLQMIDDIYYGLMLKYDGTVTSHNYYRHYTKEYITNPTLTPKLTISYE